MNHSALEKKLLSAARAQPPSDRVPYAFTQRVMHLIASQPVVDEGALWAHALWRSAAACLALVLVLGSISLFVPKPAPAIPDVAQDFEKTLLAALD